MANPQKHPAPRWGIDALSLATLAGVLALLVVSIADWRDTRRIESTLGGRLGQIETRLAQVADKVAQTPAARPARGPDPNRAYTINSAGAPAKGPATAPVTIAEFSDFQ